MNIAVWLVCLVAQMAVLAAFGEWVAMRLCGWRPLREGAAEFSFCLGLAAYSLIGSAALMIGHSSRGVPVAVALAAVRHVAALDGGEARVHLHDGSQVRCSRQRRAELLARLGHG
ncbi:MAG: hypothetical protein JNL62_26530 [Bryobacterales bacterium]|nr:hypothetical protein [Bryobacterales bacterium]